MISCLRTKGRRPFLPRPEVVLTAEECVMFGSDVQAEDFNLDLLLADLRKLCYLVANPGGTVLNVYFKVDNVPICPGHSESEDTYAFALRPKKLN